MPSKVITAATLRSIVRSAAGTTTPSVGKGRTIKQNVTSSIAKVASVPKAGGTGIVSSR